MLARHRVSVRVFTLPSEILLITADHPFHLLSCLCGSRSSVRSTHCHEDKLNLSFQGTTITVISAHQKIEPFLRKIESWRTCIEINVTDTELCVNELESQVSDILSDICNIYGSQFVVKRNLAPGAQWL
jgi:hypothetical protein